MVLTIFYTFSRGGVLVLGVALLGFIALYPRRLAALPTLLVAGAGSAILIAGATQRDALQERVLSDAAHVQGDEMLAMALVVCTGVGLLQVAIGLTAQYGLGPRPKVTARRLAALAVGAACTAVVIGLVAGLPGEVADRWTETDEPVGTRSARNVSRTSAPRAGACTGSRPWTPTPRPRWSASVPERSNTGGRATAFPVSPSLETRTPVRRDAR